ncbi:15-hydroxyprostaglandin dehydrogenase [NAD(+)]-like [Dendroctonus ponderosae]|uniref:Alcohol dehydrogenase-like C-terminal domain-containing protein n=1 Tax=Dendroctonus ponderosae TaxID=77166 RepID=A0AAR5PPH2_DENPD|nr:15-hydroxyprostaglandin dehydrogenase [NAD(+)]-like [Dendroctonus ponderosae]KAH1019921.1 hypothetical protein HUJ04_009664 [Dendroctonus ponderosae]KAH1019923.1 hypothetical protein HUJ04_009666 [Dendroctonus ponderosae]KAH1019937.1 hypothetical protein HUJ04_009681 [Dendroctonus ponderosae]KAH1027055.1 hypothetical protein HUJ05_000623 [Dendroctonus ponderosae]
MFRVLTRLKPSFSECGSRKSSHPPPCPHVEPGEKPQYSKPDCSRAVIIGGTGSVGLATATQLLCAKAAKVALIDTDACKGKDAVTSLNCSFGKDKALFLKADVTNKMDIQDTLRKVRGELKHVDLIVNAFGIWDESKWEDEVKVNLLGTLNVNEIAKDIVSQPGGLVLNITGIQGIEVFTPGPALAASFLGVVGFTQSKGHERNASANGVRIVALCCGLTHSPTLKEVEQRTCCPAMANDLKNYLNEGCWQQPEAAGKAAVELLKYAPSGSIWIVEGSQLFHLRLPSLHAFRTLETQFT